MENRKRIAILMGPPALFLGFLFVLPLAIMAVYTFRAGTFGAEREVFTLANYREFLSSPSYIRLLWRSTWVAFIVSLLSVALAYPLAYYLAFRAGSRKVILLTILIVPAWTSYLLRIFQERRPASLRIMTLLDKPERREVPMHVDWVGFSIPNEFVVGYGLDYAEVYRNLPYIGILKRSVYTPSE